MLTHLKLKNFRRHEATEVSFAEDDQLILIEGRNGSGKSSLLEGIKFCLYGETRSRRSKLENLVRHGAELEGLTAELGFTQAGHDFVVTRRYENGMSHAQLTMDGNVITQGPREVTKEISRLFGLDSQGFSVAAFATQKELNGLASLAVSKRAQTVSRLVRADVFTKARDDARKEMNDSKRVLTAMGDAPDLKMAVADRDLKKEELDASLAAQQDAMQNAASLEKELESRSEVQEWYRKAIDQKSRAEGRRDAAKAALEQARKDLTAAEQNVGERPELPDLSMDSLEEQLDSINVRLAEAREAERAEQDRQLLGKELESLTRQRDELVARIDAARGSGGSTQEVVRAEQKLEQARADLDEVDDRGRSLQAQVAVLEADLQHAKKALEQSQSLDAVCDTCHQAIPEDHRHAQVDAAQGKVDEKSSQLTTATGELDSSREVWKQRRQDVASAEQELADARRQEAAIAEDERALTQLNRTINMYEQRIKALPQQGEPVATVGAEKAEVVATLQAIRTGERELRAWEKATNDLAAAKTATERADLACWQAEEEAAASQVPQDLLDAVSEVEKLASQLTAEKELASECATLAAVAEQRLAAADSMVENAQDENKKRANLMEQVENSEAASRLLSSTASQMTSRLRPALEGSVSTILSTMSEGRFDAVKIDKDYNIRVADDGKYQPMSELSGGEQDLVALSLRLALAAVVASRHGSSGPGFLVLDEVFGSQDVGRREAILDGLRALRNAYPQVLLVSHIEGTRDMVDAVLTVERVEGDDDEDETATALVTAA